MGQMLGLRKTLGFALGCSVIECYLILAYYSEKILFVPCYLLIFTYPLTLAGGPKVGRLLVVGIWGFVNMV